MFLKNKLKKEENILEFINFQQFYFMFKSNDQYLYTQYFYNNDNIDWSLFLYDHDNTIQRRNIEFLNIFKTEINERRKYFGTHQH